MPSPLRNISDTALWVAVYRAQESERKDALFHDPYARKLAGERGAQIAAGMKFAQRHSWSYVARTWLIDQIVAAEVQRGADMVINLAAGLDSRPYRMTLPAALRWVEVDLPDMVSYKQEVLADEQPVCTLERVALDLHDTTARRALFQRLGGAVKHALVISEGLIIYLDADAVAELARGLSAPPGFRRWATDLSNPALLKMLQKSLGGALAEAGSPLKFAPPDGPAFFERCGWKLVEKHSLLHTGAKLKRLPFGLRLAAFVSDPAGRKQARPWGGVCVLENSG